MEPPKFVSEYPFPPPYFRSFDSENSHQPPLIPLVHSEPYNGNVLPPLQDTFDPSKDYEMYFKSLLEELLTNVINFISESPNLTSALENKINLINSSLTNLYSGIAEYRTHHARECLCKEMLAQLSRIKEIETALSQVLEDSKRSISTITIKS